MIKDIQIYVALAIGAITLLGNFGLAVTFVVLTKKGISDLKKDYDDLKRLMVEDTGKPRFQYATDCKAYRMEMKEYFDTKFDDLSKTLEGRNNETVKRLHARIDKLEGRK